MAAQKLVWIVDGEEETETRVRDRTQFLRACRNGELVFEKPIRRTVSLPSRLSLPSRIRT
ncbi:MAG: hypothetical protein EA384_05005 [Spirochaetaceae bacterium]|nr:MAG: hypothetical protein EA384_05005 [Spirochaetaceae bacterium]